MMIEILKHTPFWVWGILVALLALGATMMQTRTISIKRLTIFPVVMIVYSFSSALLSFGAKPLYSFTWVAGLAAVVLLGRGFMRPAQVRYLADRDSFEVSGSIVPLLLMLSIFGLKYVVGVLNIQAPMLIADPMVAATVCAVLGMKSGAFLARSLAIRSAKGQEAGVSGTYPRQGFADQRS